MPCNSVRLPCNSFIVLCCNGVQCNGVSLPCNGVSLPCNGVSFLCITVLAYREMVLGCCVTVLEVLGSARRVELTLSSFARDE